MVDPGSVSIDIDTEHDHLVNKEEEQAKYGSTKTQVRWISVGITLSCSVGLSTSLVLVTRS